ncbi:unnamed protein product [Rhizophagus irregularis]|nr:unnamed protein product [Rhizophagus irregularis]
MFDQQSLFKRIHSYTSQDFLNQSTEKPFKLKIDAYLKSLEAIMNSEQGKIDNKAKLLYDDYKKESGNINEINSGINNSTSKKNELSSC